jgi:hypothetical protein
MNKILTHYKIHHWFRDAQLVSMNLRMISFWTYCSTALHQQEHSRNRLSTVVPMASDDIWLVEETQVYFRCCGSSGFVTIVPRILSFHTDWSTVSRGRADGLELSEIWYSAATFPRHQPFMPRPFACLHGDSKRDQDKVMSCWWSLSRILKALLTII